MRCSYYSNNVNKYGVRNTCAQDVLFAMLPAMQPHVHMHNNGPTDFMINLVITLPLSLTSNSQIPLQMSLELCIHNYNYSDSHLCYSWLC